MSILCSLDLTVPLPPLLQHLCHLLIKLLGLSLSQHQYRLWQASHVRYIHPERPRALTLDELVQKNDPIAILIISTLSLIHGLACHVIRADTWDSSELL